MIAVDDHDRLFVGHGIDQRREVADRIAGIVEHLAEIDQVVAAAADLRGKAGGEIGEGLRGHPRDLGEAFLFQPRRLPGEAVKLAVGRENAQPPVGGEQRQQPQEETVGVRPEGDPSGVAEIEQARDMCLSSRQDLAENLLPFAVGEPGRVFPAALLRLEGDVGPEMMAVGGKMHPLRRGGEEALEMRLVIHAPLSSA